MSDRITRAIAISPDMTLRVPLFMAKVKVAPAAEMAVVSLVMAVE